MDLTPNKIDGRDLPITQTRISAREWNQLVGSCMEFITQAGFTPDPNDNQQFLNAFIQIAQNIGAIGANVDLSNLSTTGESKFTNKANTDLSNITSTGKQRLISLCAPDYSTGIAVSSPYTATSPCWAYVNIITNGSYAGVFVTNAQTTSQQKVFYCGAAGNNANTGWILLDTGDTIIFNSGGATYDVKIFQPKGAN